MTLRPTISDSSGGSADSVSSLHDAAAGAASPVPQYYSPFQLFPLGPPIPGYLPAEAPSSPTAVPASPMSPGGCPCSRA